MRLHVVDGGYYENTGIGALVAWLNEAVTELQEKNLPKQILVITIGAFPSNTNPKYAGRRGAIFQFEAPFLTDRQFANDHPELENEDIQQGYVCQHCQEPVIAYISIDPNADKSTDDVIVNPNGSVRTRATGTCRVPGD